MSKSKKQSPLSKPQSFEQLDQLTSELHRDFAEVELDFIRKSKFVTDRDVYVTQINELLCRFYEEMVALKPKYKNVETELLTNENLMQEINKIMQNIEAQTLSEPSSCILSERAMMLHDVESLNTKISDTVNIMYTTNEILENERQMPENIEKITAILAEQIQTLLNIEKNLENNLSKCEDIENLFNLSKKNYEN